MPVASTRLSTRLIPPSSSRTSCGKMRQLAWTLVYFASPFILWLHAFQIVVTSCRGSEIHQVFFDYPASPFSTYTPSCSLPLCQIVFIHMADFFFCIPPLPANHLPRLHRWQTLLSELRATKLTLAVQSWMWSRSCARVHFRVLAITVESGHDGLRRQEMRRWKEKRGCTNWENKKKGTL